MTRTATSRKPFIVDVDASLLKRNIELTKQARHLYTTMRAISCGRTGALKIRDRWLKATAIDAAAEMCRDVRLRAMRELIALGLVTMEHKRVERVIGGRKRVVFDAVHYFVHRQPVAAKNAKKQPFLLESIFSTVEKIDSQISSETPYGPGRGASPVGERKADEKIYIKSSSGSPAKPDDDFHVFSLKANPFLPDEIKTLLDRIRRRLRERWPQLSESYKNQLQDDDFLSSAIEMIDERGEEQIVNPIAYFTTALIEILFTAYGPDPETFDDDFGVLIEKAQKKRELREKYMAKLQPLTEEQERARQQFNRMVEGKSQ